MPSKESKILKAIRRRRLELRKKRARWAKSGLRRFAKAAHRAKRTIEKLKRRLRKVRHHPQQGVDSYSAIPGAALRDAGKTFTCRYLSHIPGKGITKNEVHDLLTHGVQILVVYEEEADAAGKGRVRGEEDAEKALTLARAAGKPDDRGAIFLAVDYEADPRSVRAYFEGAAHVLGKNYTGAYGDYDVVKYLIENGVVGYGWQTYAWSGHRRYKPAHVWQYLNEAESIHGTVVDLDQSNHYDFGQW